MYPLPKGSGFTETSDKNDLISKDQIKENTSWFPKKYMEIINIEEFILDESGINNLEIEEYMKTLGIIDSIKLYL